MNILKSEWLKLVSVRTTWLILLFMVVLEGLVAVLATRAGAAEAMAT